MILHALSKRRRGFTLLETLVAATLFSVFTITLSQLLMGGMATFKKGRAISSLRADLRTTLDVMSAEFRSASESSSIYPPLNSGYQKVSSYLSFKRTMKDESSTGGLGTKNANITYTLSYADGTLVRQVDDGNPVLLAENILVGDRIGEQGGTNPNSFFAWVVNQTSASTQRGNVMEMRLTGAKYIGTELQKMSVVTYSNYRSAARNSEGTTKQYNNVSPNVDASRVQLFGGTATDLAVPPAAVRRSFFNDRL